MLNIRPHLLLPGIIPRKCNLRVNKFHIPFIPACPWVYISLLQWPPQQEVNHIVKTYVLIAFVAISLVVSCIMIGIITHISVMERTKEIGILRALGASKRNISQVFNAETFIIGCCAGVLDIGVSLLALLPINAIIAKVSGLTDLTARLPVQSDTALTKASPEFMTTSAITARDTPKPMIDVPTRVMAAWTW